jgi:non-ribosomal peptide synthetase component F
METDELLLSRTRRWKKPNRGDNFFVGREGSFDLSKSPFNGCRFVVASRIEPMPGSWAREFIANGGRSVERGSRLGVLLPRSVRLQAGVAATWRGNV